MVRLPKETTQADQREVYMFAEGRGALQTDIADIQVEHLRRCRSFAWSGCLTIELLRF